MKLTRKQALPILDVSFPDYGGRKIKLVFASKIMFCDTNWSGGTKNEYHIVRANGQTDRIFIPAPWNNPIEGEVAELAAGILVVMRSWFHGQDLGITIYAHPQWAPKWLEEGK